jgi:hypothetical protein
MTTKPRKSTTRPTQVSKPPMGQPSDRQQPTSGGNWKKNLETLELPSGNVMRVKNPGIMELAHKGLIPNALMTIIMDAIKRGQEPKPEDILSDNIEITEMFDMMDNAIMEMAIDPIILPVPVVEDGMVEARDPEALYIDEVAEEDKLFIWGWATGGSTDLEQFRIERAGVLASIPGQPTVAEDPKRTPQD